MNKERENRGLLYCALGVVVMVVVWGFMLVGSPSYNRKLSADRERIRDFQSISTGIQLYYEEYKGLPDKLADPIVVENSFSCRSLVQ